MQNYERFTFSRDYHKLMGLNNTQLDDRHSMAFLERKLEDERQKRQSEVIKRIEQEEVNRVRKLLMLGYITDKNENDYQDYFKATRGSARKTRRLSLSGHSNMPAIAPKTVTIHDDDTEKAWKVKPHRPKPEDFPERNIMTYATPPKLPFINGKTSPPGATNMRIHRHRTETPAYSPDCARYPIMSPRRLSVSEKPDEDDDEVEDLEQKHTEQYTEKIFDDDTDGDGSSLIEYLRTYDESLGKPQSDEGEPWWTWTARKPKPPRSAIRFKYNGVSTIETRYIPPRTPEPVKEFLHTQTVADLYKEAEILVGRR